MPEPCCPVTGALTVSSPANSTRTGSGRCSPTTSLTSSTTTRFIKVERRLFLLLRGVSSASNSRLNTRVILVPKKDVNARLCAGCVEQGRGGGISRGNGRSHVGGRPLDRWRAVRNGQKERTTSAEWRVIAENGRAHYQGARRQPVVHFRGDPSPHFSAIVQSLRYRSAFRSSC